MVRIFLDKYVQGKDSRRGRYQPAGAIGNADVRVANRDRAMGNFKSILFGAIAALATIIWGHLLLQLVLAANFLHQ